MPDPILALCNARPLPFTCRLENNDGPFGPSLLANLVGREGIEPPQPKAADLQSAELTTCSICPARHPDRR